MPDLKPLSKCKTVGELLSHKSRWTRHAMARTKLETLTSPLARNAVQFCLLGACHRVYRDHVEHNLVCSRLREAMHKHLKYSFLTHHDSLAWFNDDADVTFNDIKRIVKAAGV